jgi:hypothetical protein
VKSPDLFSRAVSFRHSSHLEHKNDFWCAQAQANGNAAVDRRTIDIFVSAPTDVQKEHSIAEQLIRSAADEFHLSINVWYSNPLRGSSAENSVESEAFSEQSPPVLCPCFWEYPEPEQDDFPEVPNTGLYDLVVCILWSRLGTTLAPQCVMPDGSRPGSATDYEVAWALYQSKQTPGCPGLHIYRSRATPAAPLEPREKREHFFRQWDAVQEFFTAQEKDVETGFRGCCHDFQDLEEFEDLFRKHFREFLARRLNTAIASGKTSPKVPYSRSNPFRGLDSFDSEHSAIYHGRTRAVGEVFDILKTQAAAKKRLLLVLGPSGSGKSSLIHAGVLPLITRGATPAGTGPWRRALTRLDGTGDPFNTIADALLAKSALPELQGATSPEASRDLASQLRRDPGGVAARIRKVMDRLTEQELDHFSANRGEEAPPAGENENIQIAQLASLTRVKPMTQLVLVVDQLEELFTRFSPVIQQKYIAALSALADCRQVFIIAILRSDFCPDYRRLSELTALGGRYELQPPTPRGIGDIIRFRTQAAGLRFEQDPETNRSLDETIATAAVANPEALPLLEHLLSRLYEKQLARKDGLLLWADYRALGGFHNALAQHAEFVFLNLRSDEQESLKFVIRDLLVPSRREEAFLNRRSVPYRDLVLNPQLDQQQRAAAKGLVDRFIKEGLLSARTDPQQELLISIPQEALLRRWPRLWKLLSEDRRFLRMRERLDASMKPWIIHGRGREDLLECGIDLAEAQTLLTDFGSHLNETQIDYIKKSLARHKPRKLPQRIGTAAIAGLAVFGAFVGGEQFNAESHRTDKEHDIRVAEQNTDLGARQRSELEAERGALELRLKEAEQKLQIAQQKANFAVALGTELKKTQEEKAQLAQQNTDLDNSRRSQLVTQRSLEAQLKKTEEKLQIAQQDADLAKSASSPLETELRKTQEENAELTQRSSNLADNQQSEQETQRSQEAQLKDTQDKLQLAQKNADLANAERVSLEADLEKAQQEKARLAQQNSALADAQSSEQQARRSLETQLKQTQDKLRTAQDYADLADTQRSALDNQLKDEQVKLEQAQTEADDAKSQLLAIQAQLKPKPEREQNRQANNDSSTSEIRAVSPDALTGSKTEVVFEEKQNNLPKEKDALLTPPHDASPLPLPLPSPVKESEALNSAKPQPVLSTFADDKALVKQFILEYIKSVASDDVSLQRPYFGEQVNYYGEGVIGSPKIEASLKSYHTQWPVRNWEPRGEAKVARLKDPNLFAVLQPFNWSLADGPNQSQGNATLYARVRKTSPGKFQIEYLRQLTADRSGRRHRKRK